MRLSQKAILLIPLGLLIVGIIFTWYQLQQGDTNLLPTAANLFDGSGLDQENEIHPLSITTLRQGEYPGSQITIEEKLEPGSNYQRYLASYRSEGLKIYALLTIPNGEKPATGWPTIVFNHGYIPPEQYRTTEKYISYTDGFSKNGYILFRPDYRGHGNSEGTPSGAYGSSDYTIDVLNAVASLKQHPDVNPNKIGMWGHSMGGHITLRSMVVSSDIKAGVIWAGVVGSYPDLINNWRRRSPLPSASATTRGRWRQQLIEIYGDPEANPEFWSSISASTFLTDISGPLQLHHGTNDSSVPPVFSESLAGRLRAANQVVELYMYPGDDHNLSKSFLTAMQRSVTFFDQHVKNRINQ